MIVALPARMQTGVPCAAILLILDGSSRNSSEEKIKHLVGVSVRFRNDHVLCLYGEGALLELVVFIGGYFDC